MEKQQNKSSEFKQIHTFDRFFTKARGVHLFPEEKISMLAMLEKMRVETEPMAIMETNEDQVAVNS